MNEKALKNVFDGLQPCDSNLLEKINPVHILYKKNIIILASGKFFWKSVAHAKNALRHHIKYTNYMNRIYLNKTEVDEILEYLYKNIEFVSYRRLNENFYAIH